MIALVEFASKVFAEAQARTSAVNMDASQDFDAETDVLHHLNVSDQTVLFAQRQRNVRRK